MSTTFNTPMTVLLAHAIHTL